MGMTWTSRKRWYICAAYVSNRDGPLVCKAVSNPPHHRGSVHVDQQRRIVRQRRHRVHPLLERVRDPTLQGGKLVGHELQGAYVGHDEAISNDRKGRGHASGGWYSARSTPRSRSCNATLPDGDTIMSPTRHEGRRYRSRGAGHRQFRPENTLARLRPARRPKSAAGCRRTRLRIGYQKGDSRPILALRTLTTRQRVGAAPRTPRDGSDRRSLRTRSSHP